MYGNVILVGVCSNGSCELLIATSGLDNRPKKYCISLDNQNWLHFCIYKVSV